MGGRGRLSRPFFVSRTLSSPLILDDCIRLNIRPHTLQVLLAAKERLNDLGYSLCRLPSTSLGPAVGDPTVFSHQKAGRIIPRLRGTSVIYRGGDFPSLKNVIFRIPGKNQKGII